MGGNRKHLLYAHTAGNESYHISNLNFVDVMGDRIYAFVDLRAWIRFINVRPTRRMTTVATMAKTRITPGFLAAQFLRFINW